MLYRRQELPEPTPETPVEETPTVEIEEVVPPTPVSSEEDTFKKRYGDLRRYIDTQLKPGYQRQLDELKEQVRTLTTAQIKMPKSEDEVETWAKEYPDVAAIVETIAAKKAQSYTSALDEKIKGVEDRQRQVERSKAEFELRKLHPDLDDIKRDTRFADWIKVQPQWIQHSLLVNDTDAVAAARALDLYKFDLNKNTAQPKPTNKPKEAASVVKVSAAPEVPRGEPKISFRESDVKKMHPREFEAKYDEIMKARTEGRFLYDLSGVR